MKPDPDYIKRVLDAFEGSRKPFPSISDLREQDPGIEEDDTLVFHLLQMQDRGLLADANGEPDIGIQVCSDGEIVVSIVPLRLTSAGHEFAQQLRNPVVYEKVKGVMGESGFAVAVQVAGAIATQLAMRTLGLPGA